MGRYPGLAGLAFVAVLGSASNSAAADTQLATPGRLFVAADRLVPVFGYTIASSVASQGTVETTTTDRGAAFAMLVGREPGLATVHSLPRLAADFAVRSNLTVGTALPLGLGIGGTHTERRVQNGGTTERSHASPGATLFGFAPRVGYLIPVAPTLAFWGRGGVAFYSVGTTSEQANEGSPTAKTTTTETLFSLDLEPQVVWTPTRQLFVALGLLANVPLIGARSTELSQGALSATRTDDLTVFRIGLSLSAGGVFDLRGEPSTAKPPSPAPPASEPPELAAPVEPTSDRDPSAPVPTRATPVTPEP